MVMNMGWGGQRIRWLVESVGIGCIMGIKTNFEVYS
jgi:hypothetical protein